MTAAQDGGEVVSFTHRPPLRPFLLQAESASRAIGRILCQ